MVFCCGPVDDLTAEERYVVGNKYAHNAVPQQRHQFIPTNGNALIAGSPPTNLGHEGEDLVSGKTERNRKHKYPVFASSENFVLVCAHKQLLYLTVSVAVKRSQF
jgi:hypothetical protein